MVHRHTSGCPHRHLKFISDVVYWVLREDKMTVLMTFYLAFFNAGQDLANPHIRLGVRPNENRNQQNDHIAEHKPTSSLSLFLFLPFHKVSLFPDAAVLNRRGRTYIASFLASSYSYLFLLPCRPLPPKLKPTTAASRIFPSFTNRQNTIPLEPCAKHLSSRSSTFTTCVPRLNKLPRLTKNTTAVAFSIPTTRTTTL